MQAKTAAEIEILALGGRELARIMRELAALVLPGANAADLNKRAEAMIAEFGGEPAFKGYGEPGQEFPAALCVSPNDMLVHGIPYKELIFKEGDIIGLDLGLKYKGLYTDHAVTVPVGKISDQAALLLRVTRECLDIGIQKAQVGNHIGDIGHAVSRHAKKFGFGVVRRLTGHGVGYGVHEDPLVPNYGESGKGAKIVEGAVLAIEPMLNLGTHEIKTADDGWGVSSADGQSAAHFEHTVAVTAKGPRILTK